jgi:hypothetical protein
VFENNSALKRRPCRSELARDLLILKRSRGKLAPTGRDQISGKKRINGVPGFDFDQDFARIGVIAS